MLPQRSRALIAPPRVPQEAEKQEYLFDEKVAGTAWWKAGRLEGLALV